jgi:hydroxyacylglutathione hydrolase
MTEPVQFFTSKQVADRIWSIDGPSNDLMYLVLGSKKAMLVDTGMGIGDLKKLVGSLTDLPLMVVNTHGHPDHAGGNAGFDEVWISPKDENVRSRMTRYDYRARDYKAANAGTNPKAAVFLNALVPDRLYMIHPLSVDQVIDLGGRSFEVLEIPGHTPGSVCLLNSKEKIIFSGDSIIATPAWLYLKHSLPLHVYFESLVKMRDRVEEFETIFPGHNPTPIGRQNLHDLIACCEEILAKPGMGVLTQTFVGEGVLWQHGLAQIIYNPDNL